jgi:hypothetical protein
VKCSKKGQVRAKGKKKKKGLFFFFLKKPAGAYRQRGLLLGRHVTNHNPSSANRKLRLLGLFCLGLQESVKVEVRQQRVGGRMMAGRIFEHIAKEFGMSLKAVKSLSSQEGIQGTPAAFRQGKEHKTIPTKKASITKLADIYISFFFFLFFCLPDVVVVEEAQYGRVGAVSALFAQPD